MQSSTLLPEPSAFSVFCMAALPDLLKNFMTMPCERTRSVIQAREFLIALSRNTDLPETICRQAKQLLRHYPSRMEMLDAGQMEEHPEFIE